MKIQKDSRSSSIPYRKVPFELIKISLSSLLCEENINSFPGLVSYEEINPNEPNFSYFTESETEHYN